MQELFLKLKIKLIANKSQLKPKINHTSKQQNVQIQIFFFYQYKLKFCFKNMIIKIFLDHFVYTENIADQRFVDDSCQHDKNWHKSTAEQHFSITTNEN